MSDVLLSYYGDDFTGSTDVMEALARAGLPTALFLAPPSPAQLRRFPGLRAFGIAGTSRSMSPREMGRALPPVFRALRESGAPLVHYKTCSTFDSSPGVGSIGRAIDLGQAVFHSPIVPLLVGAPVLGRYCLFGNLFARSGLDSEPARLDRHPTMRRHPTTPMDEADLRAHLAKQTRKRIGLFDVLKLEAPDYRERFVKERDEIVLLDVLNEGHLPRLGELIAGRSSRRQPLFCAGSSGIEYALTAHWQAAGGIPAPPPTPPLGAARQLVCVSGSCSPVTARQIAWAERNGFTAIALDTAALIRARTARSAIATVTAGAAPQLRAGRNVLFHTALGPDDARLASTRAALKAARKRSAEALGTALGRLLRAALDHAPEARAAVTGGDTSAYVARALGIEALEFAAPVAPGSPLCRVHSAGAAVHGREIVFKGGQVGHDDFFGTLLHGSTSKPRNKHP